jgi:hypothetical protein
MSIHGGNPSLAPVLAVQLKRAFRDKHDRRAYLRAYILGKRLLENPALLEKGRVFLERFVKGDPRQRHIYALWMEALSHPVDEVVARLLADNEQGAALRETAPVFVVVSADEVRALERAAA